MKKYKYLVTRMDGSEILMELEADSVLDGHYQIYRLLGRGGYKKSTLVNN